MLTLLQILVLTICHLLWILAIMAVLRQNLKVALICIFLIAKHVGHFKSVSHEFQCSLLRILCLYLYPVLKLEYVAVDIKF